ncbi:MAG: tRNA (guanosine(37)-N1)-methyltransferase TrmD [Candidatus Pacebacteria bacterium]|nr:tRNA (guanosine(37)-N1)-methyltransferase TrmD [Candidatus Paceibacterota bacterium]PIR60798.1 MAG: tRNA (guanosine(37)-N1)-methyltransferase TrmD [Candidatus Pacebacteria bacterium CG10_big_fil_rev_8_21_14_0_10_44_54]
MNLKILSLFPDYFSSGLATSLMRRAIIEKKLVVDLVNIRDYTTDKHKITDERPYGGGAGMVLKVEPIVRALRDIDVKRHAAKSKVVLLSAQGSPYTQTDAVRYAQMDELILICGHYEGVDERVAEHYADEEKRIGDYVLMGGEVAAMVIAESVTRLLPGVLGNPESNKGESHSEPGFLGFPQYTRPEVFEGHRVPKVLLSGDHRAIKKWREEQRK